jgi:hypothetical protein
MCLTEDSKQGGIFNLNWIFTQNIRPYFGKNMEILHPLI